MQINSEVKGPARPYRRVKNFPGGLSSDRLKGPKAHERKKFRGPRKRRLGASHSRKKHWARQRYAQKGGQRNPIQKKKEAHKRETRDRWSNIDYLELR